MKRKLSIILILLFATVIHAQEADLDKANELFEERNFHQAAEIYEVAEKNKEVLQKLGDSYFFTNQIKKAANAYQDLFREYENFPEELQFRYAQSLKGVGKYSEADKILTGLYGQNVNTLKTFDSINVHRPFLFEIQKVQESSKYADFGGAIINDRIVFTSGRNLERPLYVWTQEPYLDLYTAEVGENGKLSNPTLLAGNINTDQHESSATFSADGNTMYFDRTSDSRVRIGDARVATIKIFKAEKVDGQWQNIEAVPFSGAKYSVEHPALSPDGKRLYFSSDMPGGHGSFDIYYVDIKSDGSFGTPVNLGANVNTVHREQFPFVGKDEYIYFASNGHLNNLGGLDIYRTEQKENSFSKAENLGSQINSGQDDFAYVKHPNLDFGFFASNRGGNDDLFNFYKDPKSIVNGVVRDLNTGEPLADAVISVYDENNEKLEDFTVDEEGEFEFYLKPYSSYKLKSTYPKYEPIELEFTTKGEGETTSLEIIMESYDSKEEKIVLKNLKTQVEMENIYFPFDKYHITPKAATTLDELVALLKKYPEMELEIASHTDVRGPVSYNQVLSQKRAESTLEYLVEQGIERSRLSAKGYGESEPVNECIEEGICTEEEYELNRRSEFTILQ